MTRASLKKEVKAHIGKLVIIDFTIVRLIDIEEDEDDFYYAVCTMTNQVVHYSINCALTKLKGKIDKNRYDYMVRVWNQNALTPAN